MVQAAGVGEGASALGQLIEHCLDEYDAADERAYVDSFGDGETRRVLIARGRRYDADAVETAVALKLATPKLGSNRIDVQWEPSGSLEDAGYPVVDLDGWSVEDELAWRLSAWRELGRHGAIVEASWLNHRGIYKAKQGIWADKARTHRLAEHGAAVAVLHTGRHYADDLDEQMIIYHYPNTGRVGARDHNEVQAVKNLMKLRLPVFVISQTPKGLREVRLGWVVAEDDGAGAFLIEFTESEPNHLEFGDVDTIPFELYSGRRRRPSHGNRIVRDREFTFRLLCRYNSRCAITGVGVPQVLDGAHVVPVHKGGTDDERNGLLLTANLHRAFDANLWALHPRTLRVVTRPQGPSFGELQVTAVGLRSDATPPHRKALEWRYQQFCKIAGTDPGGASDASAVL